MTELTPSTPEQVLECVTWALSETTPLKIIGNDSRAGLGHDVQADTTLSTRALSGITLYEPGELVLSAYAGTPLSVIEQALAAENQHMLFDAPTLQPILRTTDKVPTIGGMVAIGYGGSRRPFAGSVRDHVLGVKGVHGRGDPFVTGGRVVKNVTGYDLSKLITGSFGTLGVMTEITFKVLPKPETETTLVLEAETEADLLAQLRAISILPVEATGLTILPHWAADCLSLSAQAVGLVRLEGVRPSVDARIKTIEEAQKLSFLRVEEEKSKQLWQQIKEVQVIFGSESREPLWRISVAPTDGATVMEKLAGLGAHCFADWIGGLIWATVPADACAHVRSCVPEGAGHATLVRASDQLKETVPVFQPQPSALASLTARVKTAFDPEHILNPGVMTPLNAAQKVA